MTVTVTSVAAVTVRVAEPVTEPDVAVICVVPVAAVSARPRELIDATVVFATPQLTWLVRFCVLPSVNVPIAVNGCELPSATDGVGGVTAMETSATALTVRLVDPEIDPTVAVIVVAPVVTGIARPALTVAIALCDDVQVALAVRFCIVPSVNVPVAVNCCVVPSGTEALSGVTEIATNFAAVTVSTVLPDTVLFVAEIVLCPMAFDVTRPAALIVATAEEDEAQVTEFVMSSVLPLE